MFIQGNLQVIFDALYNLGVIDPVMNEDWSNTVAAMEKNPLKVNAVVTAANRCPDDYQVMFQTLKSFDYQSLSFLALEVAREFADFTYCQTLH
jgi:hypothetical protein